MYFFSSFHFLAQNLLTCELLRKVWSHFFLHLFCVQKSCTDVTLLSRNRIFCNRKMEGRWKEKRKTVNFCKVITLCLLFIYDTIRWSVIYAVLMLYVIDEILRSDLPPTGHWSMVYAKNNLTIVVWNEEAYEICIFIFSYWKSLCHIMRNNLVDIFCMNIMDIDTIYKRRIHRWMKKKKKWQWESRYACAYTCFSSFFSCGKLKP